MFDHLRSTGYVVQRKHRDFVLREPQALWTVQGLAKACGIHRNQAGKAISELLDYGYMTRDDLRRIGQFGGFAYALRLPNGLTPQAKRKLKERLKEKHIDLEDLKQRALRYLSEKELKDVLMEIEEEENKSDVRKIP
jgi:hypothetical protein